MDVRFPRATRLAPAVFIASIFCVAWRITRGVDFSDESYYAIFLHEWFKEGVSASPFLMLHQTSVLLIYPLALVYREIVGSTDGLMLFLRCVYLAGSTTAALVVVRFLRQAQVGPLRWIAGACLVTFVPYNLPAPSYNTLGLQAMLVACATFGCAVLKAQAGQRATRCLILCAVAWAFAIVAYPSLLLPLFVLTLGMLIIVRPTRTFASFYGLAVMIGQAVAWTAVFWILGWQRIVRSVDFQGKLNSMFEVRETPARVFALFRNNPGFALVLLLALLLGLLRKKIPVAVATLAITLLVASLLFLPPALFVVSHGALIAVALGGVALLGDLRPQANANTKLFSLLYATSWAAGLGMAGSATLGAFKAPVGAALAAVIAVVMAGERCLAVGRTGLALVPGIGLWGVLLISLYQSYYGELPLGRPTIRVRITQGAFSGLAATADDARLIEIARRALDQYERLGDTLAVVGRMSGIYLLSNAPVRALVPYTLTPFVQPAGRHATHDYYASAENRPSLVMVYRDPHFPMIDPFEPDFANWYGLRARFSTPLGSLEVFRRTDEPH
jgi:hypothetical protein